MKLFDSDKPNSPERIPLCENKNNSLSLPITENEVKMSIKRVKTKAKSMINLSPVDINNVCDSLAAFLQRYYNLILEGEINFSTKWLESSLFLSIKEKVKKICLKTIDLFLYRIHC